MFQLLYCRSRDRINAANGSTGGGGGSSAATRGTNAPLPLATRYNSAPQLAW